MKKKIFAIGLSCFIFLFNLISVSCNELQMETTEIPNWPSAPDISAEAAILLEANTGIILYSKNIHAHLFPASTTKMMTALLAAENCEMDETVKFSYDAVFSLESGSSNIGIDPGQYMPMEECLYGLLTASANEVANAIGEHVSGSMDDFVNDMNKRATELGLKDTHFMNPSGLHDNNHYTSAYDLAIIAKEFFGNDDLLRIGNTPSHHFEPSEGQPDDFYVRNKHKLISGEIPYAGIKGGKTGYTEKAGETLVTMCEQDGMKLICVVLKDESPEQFQDTVRLFDYGLSNFKVTNISENETGFSIKSNDFFPTSVDILGSSKQILELDTDNYIIMPTNITFKNLEREVSYDTLYDNEIVYIYYSYHGVDLGHGVVKLKGADVVTSVFDDNLEEVKEETVIEKEKPTYINVVQIAKYIVIVGGIGILLSFIISFFVNYNVVDNIKKNKKTKVKKSHRREKSKLKF